jgi:hypothetical protein
VTPSHSASPAPRPWSALFLAALAAFLGACDGDEDPPRLYAQADLVGSWDFATLRTGTAPGWERGTASVDASGTVSLVSFLDDHGNVDPGPQQENVVAVDPMTGELSARVGGVVSPFHGTLARSKNLFAAVSTPEPGTYFLMLARRRGATAYSDADIRGRTVALHALRIGGDREWRYGTGSIDAQGVLTLGPVIGPSLLPIAAPAPDGATLAVDGEGFVSDGGSFRGFLTPDKNAVIAVHLDSSSPSATHQLTILQLTGRTFAQADLAGTWAFESFAGNVSPIWYHGTLEIGATGVARYLPPFRDSNGSTALPPDMALTLAPDGTMTQPATNPSYRATLSMDGEMYVRTQTHNPPGRYGLGVALRR